MEKDKRVKRYQSLKHWLPKQTISLLPDLIIINLYDGDAVLDFFNNDGLIFKPTKNIAFFGLFTIQVWSWQNESIRHCCKTYITELFLARIVFNHVTVILEIIVESVVTVFSGKSILSSLWMKFQMCSVDNNKHEAIANSKKFCHFPTSYYGI